MINYPGKQLKISSNLVHFGVKELGVEGKNND